MANRILSVVAQDDTLTVTFTSPYTIDNPGGEASNWQFHGMGEDLETAASYELLSDNTLLLTFGIAPAPGQTWFYLGDQATPATGTIAAPLLEPIETVVFNKLAGTDAIAALVTDGAGGLKIYPEFRDDAVPSIVFGCDLSETEEAYDFTGPVTYDLSIAAVGSTIKQALQLADVIVDTLNRADEWSDSGFRVVSVFLRPSGRKVESLELADKNLRLGAVFLDFDFTVDALTATP